VDEELTGQPTAVLFRGFAIVRIMNYTVVSQASRSNYRISLGSHTNLRSVMALTIQPVPVTSVN
jgi:hypothetical protein